MYCLIQSRDLAYKAGLAKQNSKTGFIHEEERIPLYENFCFVLALLRMRKSETILEAKRLLERLLPFEVEGNFPPFLDLYPLCPDGYFSYHLLPIFFWIRKDFWSLLGEMLQEKMDALLKRILKRAEEIVPSGSALSKVRAFQGESIPCDGEDQLIVSQMLNKAISLPSWNATYAVSGLAQEGPLPEVTLTDLYAVAHFDCYPERILKGGNHLHGALIQEGEIKGGFAPDFQIFEEGPIAMRYLFGTKEEAHSLVLARNDLDIEVQEGGLVLKLNGARDDMEVSLFINASHSIFVEGEKATLFQIGDQIEAGPFQLRFEAEEGIFVGHIFKANRPLQKQVDRFAAYDWQIALRTIERKGPVSIFLSIKKDPS